MWVGVCARVAEGAVPLTDKLDGGGRHARNNRENEGRIGHGKWHGMHSTTRPPKKEETRTCLRLVRREPLQVVLAHDGRLDVGDAALYNGVDGWWVCLSV